MLWKTAIPGRGHSQPIVWGNRVFVTTAVEGEVVPGAEAVKHRIEGKEFVHPDSVGAEQEAHVQGAGPRRGHAASIALGADGLGGHALRRPPQEASYAAPTPVTDGRAVYAYFGIRGPLRLRLRRQAGLEGDARARSPRWAWRSGTSPVLYGDLVILQCDEDNGENSFIVASTSKTGKEAWRVPRPGAGELGDARDRRARASRSARSWSRPATSAVIAYDPATGKELWRTRASTANAIPSAGDGPGPGRRLGGLSGQGRDGDQARRLRRHHRHAAHPLEVREGHRLRALADPRTATTSTW